MEFYFTVKKAVKKESNSCRKIASKNIGFVKMESE